MPFPKRTETSFLGAGSTCGASFSRVGSIGPRREVRLAKFRRRRPALHSRSYIASTVMSWGREGESASQSRLDLAWRTLSLASDQQPELRVATLIHCEAGK